MSEYFERLYSILPWPEDPFSGEGYDRYVKALEKFRSIISYEWFNQIIALKEDVSVIDVCGGTGIGGIALTKILMDKGKNVRLTILDIRESALKKALEFGLKELGFKVEMIVMDVREVNKIGEKYDVALMYGFSSPHFNPWDMTKVLASISEILVDNGILILDEGDRIQTVFLSRGYQQILPEISEDKIVISIHKSYNSITGEFTRLMINLLNGDREEMKVYFWGLAELMNMLWIFFNDIDFIRYPSTPHAGIIIAYKPRRKLKPEDFSQNPKIIKNL